MADVIDVEIGRRIREVRITRGMSQSDLASALGISFQQVQKYERGANRVGSGRLYRISKVLEVPVTFFYDGLDPLLGQEPTAAPEVRMPRGTLRVAAMLEELPDDDVKNEVIRLIKVFAKSA